MTVRAVIFDLDNTLAVPVRSRTTMLDRATRRVGAPRVSRTDYLAAHRSNIARETRSPIFASLLAESDVDPDTLAAAYRSEIADSLRSVVGAHDLICDLRHDYRVGLLTNGPSVAQRDKLRVLGWSDLFDGVVITGEIGVAKPDPGAFEAILSVLEVRADEAVYIGDEPSMDVIGASASGLQPIQVHFPGGPRIDARAVATVDRDRIASELPAVLDRLENDD